MEKDFVEKVKLLEVKVYTPEDIKSLSLESKKDEELAKQLVINEKRC